MKTTHIRSLYKLFQSGAYKAITHTHERAEHTTHDFWRLLIVAGHWFRHDDLEGIYWRDESHYTSAVAWDNTSFCRAYERQGGREPFIGSEIEYRRHDGPLHATTCKSQGRLTIGAKFEWQGERVAVTSFKDSKHALIACAYQPKPSYPNPGYDAHNKIKKRFTITHAQWHEKQRAKKQNFGPASGVK